MTFKCLRKGCEHETTYGPNEKISCPECGCQYAERIK